MPRNSSTSSSTQLSLLEAAAQPKREARMGRVEGERWASDWSERGPWHWSERGWCDDQGVAPVLIGVDEAGRGPLAGPVSVAAVVLDPGQVGNGSPLEWVREVDDSKKLTEAKRRRLFGGIVRSARSWAIVHVHSDQVDEVNILQATFQGMAIAVEQVLGLEVSGWERRPTVAVQTVERDGGALAEEERCWYRDRLMHDRALSGADVVVYRPEDATVSHGLVVLVDGNARFVVPGSPASGLGQEPIVKGDALSMHIAAASVLAKVSRDRTMAVCDELWPAYGFGGHKGYPTRAHKAALSKQGACPVHRRSFRW